MFFLVVVITSEIAFEIVYKYFFKKETDIME